MNQAMNPTIRNTYLSTIQKPFFIITFVVLCHYLIIVVNGMGNCQNSHLNLGVNDFVPECTPDGNYKVSEYHWWKLLITLLIITIGQTMR